MARASGFLIIVGLSMEIDAGKPEDYLQFTERALEPVDPETFMSPPEDNRRKPKSIRINTRERNRKATKR